VGGDDQKTELRMRAMEIAAQCVRVSSIADAALVFQLADMLVQYALTGSPLVEPPRRLM
jgi:hypothetical protein